MNGLIEALQIFRKYVGNMDCPTGCDHDILYVYIDPEEIAIIDILKLDKLGFSADEDLECFYSFRYGSA